MLGRPTTDRAGGTAPSGSDRLVDALAHLTGPDTPATRPWEFSAAAFLRPYLPKALGRASALLDRFGAVRLGPATIGLDSDRDVAWTDVVEVRTRNLFDVLTDGFVEDLRRRCTELAPPVPGVGRAARWAADKAAELALSMFLLALPDSPHDRVPDVPAEIVHRDRKGRLRQMRPGLVASAVLTLPAVRSSALATAEAHGVAVVATGPSMLTEAAGARAAALDHRRGLLAAQLATLRGDGPSESRPQPDPAQQREERDVGFFRKKATTAQEAVPAMPRRDVAPLFPHFYRTALADTGKPVTDGNMVALAGLVASNLALNASLWFDKLGDQAAKQRWMRQFGDPNLQPDFDRLVRVPDQMVDFLWAWDRRAHAGVREFVEKMHDTVRSAASEYGDELPLDMWGAKT